MFQNIYNVEKLDCCIFGLKYLPKIKGVDSNSDVTSNVCSCCFDSEVSKNEFEKIEYLVEQYQNYGDCILEIGVYRNKELSTTKAILKNKKDSIYYIGVDIDDKSLLNNKIKNIFTIKISSFDQGIVRNYLKELNIKNVSILLIDGWHSVSCVVNDWQYSDLLSKNGVVILHDTNYHPGPSVILDSIDENLFKIEKYFDGLKQWGLSAVFKK